MPSQPLVNDLRHRQRVCANKQNEESLLFLSNISFQHVSIGKTAGEMNSLRSAVIRTIYDKK